MKQLFLFLAFITLSANALRSQSNAFSNFIEEHKDDEAFTYAFLSKDLFEVAAKTEVQDKDWKRLHNVVKNIGSLSLLAADSIGNSLALYKEVVALVPTDEFDDLLTVRDGSDNVRIWVKSEESTITDLVLLVGSSEEFVLICFAGNLELGNIMELAELFEAEEIEQLARTTESTQVEFSVSPNPTGGEITLAYADEQDPPTLLTVFDQNGRQVSNLNLSGFKIQQIMLPELPSGTYWVQLKTQSGKIGVKQVQVVKK
jgi:hypothetical protein